MPFEIGEFDRSLSDEHSTFKYRFLEETRPGGFHVVQLSLEEFAREDREFDGAGRNEAAEDVFALDLDTQ
jgi:hypothetical protein